MYWITSDDLPRLVYADYLDQKLDEPEVMDVNLARAELIRTQIELKNILSEGLEAVSKKYPIVSSDFSPLRQIGDRVFSLSISAFSFLKNTVDKSPEMELINAEFCYDKIQLFIGSKLKITIDRGFIESVDLKANGCSVELPACFTDCDEIITGKVNIYIENNGCLFLKKDLPNYLNYDVNFIIHSGLISGGEHLAQYAIGFSCGMPAIPNPIEPQGVIEVPVDPVYSERPVKNSRRGSIPDHLKNNHWNRRPGRRK